VKPSVETIKIVLYSCSQCFLLLFTVFGAFFFLLYNGLLLALPSMKTAEILHSLEAQSDADVHFVASIQKPLTLPTCLLLANLCSLSILTL